MKSSSLSKRDVGFGGGGGVLRKASVASMVQGLLMVSMDLEALEGAETKCSFSVLSST